MANSNRRFADLAPFFTALVVAFLSVLGTLYVQNRSVPKIALDYAWCMAVTERLPDAKDEYATALIDLKLQSVIDGTFYTIRVDEPAGYKYLEGRRGYIGKLVLDNSGGTTATNVRIGIGYMYPTEFSIKVSPNVHAALVPIDTKIYDESAFWPIRYEVQIEDVPPHERAFVTLGWSLEPTAKGGYGEPVDPNRYYVPEILYVTSRETLGRVRSFETYNSLKDIQGNSVSDTAQPWWPIALYLEKDTHITMQAGQPNDKVKLELLFDSEPPENPSAPYDRR